MEQKNNGNFYLLNNYRELKQDIRKFFDGLYLVKTRFQKSYRQSILFCFQSLKLGNQYSYKIYLNLSL